MMSDMFDAIPKGNTTNPILAAIKQFFTEVLLGKTSFKVYLVSNFPRIFKFELKGNEVLKWKGTKVRVPKAYRYSDITGMLSILAGSYVNDNCNINDGDVVLDIGAHFGFFSFFAVANGASRVYAFEPNPDSYEVLKKNCELWGSIEPICLAVSSATGEAEMYREYGDRISSVASTLVPDRRGSILQDIEYSDKITVRTITVDDFVRKKGIERVDFIEIDVEGYEKEVLKGAKDTIMKFKPKMAIAAYHYPNDEFEIPRMVLSMRRDYNWKLVKKHDLDALFY